MDPAVLDFPAFADALWSLSDSTGLRPEYVLPVFYRESGFSTSVTNSIGCVGLNQSCPFGCGVPDGYASWSASQQVNGLIAGCFKAIIAKFGPIGSATRAYQANFLPATLGTARSLNSVLATQGGAVYAENSGLDKNKDGVITVQDLADQMSLMLAKPAVQNAIAQTYARRGGSPVSNPVYGSDFPWYTRLSTGEKLGIASAAVVVVSAGAVALRARA